MITEDFRLGNRMEHYRNTKKNNYLCSLNKWYSSSACLEVKASFYHSDTSQSEKAGVRNQNCQWKLEKNHSAAYQSIGSPSSRTHDRTLPILESTLGDCWFLAAADVSSCVDLSSLHDSGPRMKSFRLSWIGGHGDVYLSSFAAAVLADWVLYAIGKVEQFSGRVVDTLRGGGTGWKFKLLSLINNFHYTPDFQEFEAFDKNDYRYICRVWIGRYLIY